MAGNQVAHGGAGETVAQFMERRRREVELMQAKLRIDRMVAPYIRRAGLPRPNKPPS